jgi:hypothetical protein
VWKPVRSRVADIAATHDDVCNAEIVALWCLQNEVDPLLARGHTSSHPSYCCQPQILATATMLHYLAPGMTQPDLLSSMQSRRYEDLSIGGVQSRRTADWLWPMHLQPNIGIWPVL